jgi:hypothetical protein
MTAEQLFDLHRLRHAILGARDNGRVIVEFTDGPDAAVDENVARHLADAMLALVNLPVLGPHWRIIDKPRAAEVMAAVLHEDLERQTTRVPQKLAIDLAGRMLEAFAGASICLTNVRSGVDLAQAPRKWASGRPERELDAGVAMVSQELVGLLWVEDRP